MEQPILNSYKNNNLICLLVTTSVLFFVALTTQSFAAAKIGYSYLGKVDTTASSSNLSFSHVGIATDSSGRVYNTQFSFNVGVLQFDSKVDVYQSSGNSLQLDRTFGTSAGQMYLPVSIAVTPSGIVYVADLFQNKINIFSSYESGNSFLGSITSPTGPVFGSFGIASDANGNVYSAEIFQNTVYAFSAYPGNTLLGTVGSSGSGGGQYSYPFSVATDSDGYIYVADYINRRVNIYKPFAIGGGFDSAVTSADSATFTPTGLAVGKDNRLHVLDAAGSRILAFGPRSEGSKYLAKFGSKGSGSGQFNGVFSLATFNDKVYVSDYNNKRIVILKFSEGAASQSKLSMNIKRAGKQQGKVGTRLTTCYGCKATIYGILSEKSGGDGLSGQAIEIQGRTTAEGSGWKTLKSVKTKSTGRYSSDYTPIQSMRIRAVFQGNSDFDSDSDSGLLNVKDTSTLAVSKRKGSLVISGKIKSAAFQKKRKRQPGKLVAVRFKLPDSDWKIFKLLRANKNSGKYRAVIKPRRSGQVQFSALVIHDFDDAFVSGTSRSVTVTLP